MAMFYMPAKVYEESEAVMNHAADIAKFGKKALIVTAEKDENVVRSAANIPGVRTALATTMNVYEIVGHDSFIIRMESGEVYSEYYGPNWKNHIWDGYSREWAFFPRMAGADDGAKYILGECVLHRDFLAVDGGLRKYMLAVTQILLDAEMEKIS